MFLSDTFSGLSKRERERERERDREREREKWTNLEKERIKTQRSR